MGDLGVALVVGVGVPELGKLRMIDDRVHVVMGNTAAQERELGERGGGVKALREGIVPQAEDKEICQRYPPFLVTKTQTNKMINNC